MDDTVLILDDVWEPDPQLLEELVNGLQELYWHLDINHWNLWAD